MENQKQLKFNEIKGTDVRYDCAHNWNINAIVDKLLYLKSKGATHVHFDIEINTGLEYNVLGLLPFSSKSVGA